jgi:CxxC-x17-CxxC domain-containing protein
MYIIGKTGVGKSNLIENLVYSDIVNGEGCCLLDPHGDSAEKLVNCIPSNRINDVIYFNPADFDYPIAMNVLEKVEPQYRHLVASGLVGVFKKIWADSWGPRLEYLLRNTILALLDYPDSTLLGVNRMLIDNAYRKKVIAKIQDPVVKMFWVDEFSKYNQQFLTEAIAPIQNKVGQFLSTSLIRNIVGQVKSTIDFREIMDSGKILLLNLSKGRIGEDASALMGAMIITKIQLAAMSRVDIDEEKRKDFYLYVDEFQNFATDAFANILSEARKYHLCLTIAHQYIEQLGDVVKAAVFGNVGTIVSFRVGAGDSEFLAKEFAPRFTEEDMVNLPKYNVYLKLMIDGVASDPFSATVLPPLPKTTHSAEKVINVTRERYTKTRDVVEDKIMRWSGVETEASVEKLEQELKEKEAAEALAGQSGKTAERPAVTVAPRRETPLARPITRPIARVPEEAAEAEPEEKKDEIIKIVQCNGCGMKTKINFIPDPSRPVYCKECLKEYRRKQALEENAKKNSNDRRPAGAMPAHAGGRRDTAPSSAPRRDLSLSDLKRHD